MATAYAGILKDIQPQGGTSTTTAPTAMAAAAESSGLVDTMNMLLGDILGLNPDSKLVQATAKASTSKNGYITIEVTYIPGAWPSALIDLLPSKILSIDIDPKKLKGAHDFDIKIQEQVKAQLDGFVGKFVDQATSSITGVEHGLAAAAGTALKKLLASKIMEPLSKELSLSLLDLDLPDIGTIGGILDTGFDALRAEYFQAFIPEIAKTYAKLGLSEILTIATGDLDAPWITAIHGLKGGILDPILDNIVDGYFTYGPVQPGQIFNNVNFKETFADVLSGLLIDFTELDQQIVDDILGLDGNGWIESKLAKLLTEGINGLVEKGFVKGIDFLAGDFKVADLQEIFNGIDDLAQIQQLLGKFFLEYAGTELADLFIDIDSLEEGLAAQLGTWLGTNLLGDVIGGALGDLLGGVTVDALVGVFGEATASAIGGAIFEGLGTILGAGFGAIAGSVIFELLDDLFDGALSGIIGDIWDWIKNDSPQAFSGTRYDPATGQFVEWYFYHKDSNAQLDNAVKTLQRTFTEKLNEVIAFVGEPASFDPLYDNIMFAWGKKHFNESFASYIGSESNKISYRRDGEIVLKDTLGAALAHMNFHTGNPIIAKAYDLWKAEIAAAGGGLQSYIGADAFQELQDLIGLAKFANDYRQDPTVYDALMAGDGPISVTILQQYLEAETLGFHDATTLRGSDLGFEEIGSAAAGDTIHLDGPAWKAVARGGDDTVYGGTRNDLISGGTGNDVLLGNLGTDTIAGDEGDDKIYGGEGNDKLAGGTGKDLLLGDAGDDEVNGDDGDDSLFGFTGNDTLRGGAGADEIGGEDGNDRLEGGDGNDTLFGDGANAGNDTILAGAGDDVARGGGGNDAIEGGDGIDRLFGDDGDDLVKGGAGADTIEGGAGADLLEGDAGVDRLLGDAGNDALRGGTENDVLIGGAGNDWLDGGTGQDSMEGGADDDTYVVDSLLDTVIEAAGAGIDGVRTTLAAYTLVANVERLAYAGTGMFAGTGNALANSIAGGASADTLTGLQGNDTLDGGGGADRLIGGVGDDTYLVDNAGDLVTELAGEGVDLVRSLHGAYTLAANVENLSFIGAAALGFAGTGNDLANVIDTRATSGNDTLKGMAGNDTLSSGAGMDTLDGGTGADAMAGGTGDDTYVVDDAGDTVVEAAGEGTDTVKSMISSTLGANFENLTLIGGASTTATGNALANILIGNGGHNTLDGGAGADRMEGGGGDDTYYVDDAGDVIVDTSGFDSVIASKTYALAAGLGIEALSASDAPGLAPIDLTGNELANRLVGNNGVNNLKGGGGNDRLQGNGGNDVLDGGTGADLMIGGAGNDQYRVDDAADVVTEAAGEGVDTVVTALAAYSLPSHVEKLVYTGTGAFAGTGSETDNEISGGNQADTLKGMGGTDTLIGNGGNDRLEGGAGNDVLNGGAGIDVLIGGAGDDLYFVDASVELPVELANEGIDTVSTQLAAFTLGANLEKLTFTGTGAFAGTGNALDNTLAAASATAGVVLRGMAGNDRLQGGSGNDELDGGEGIDAMQGGAGNDLYMVDNAGDTANELAGGGVDTVRSSVSFTLGANVENLTLIGGASTTATGNALANILIGNGGHNTLDGGAGADRMEGGAGDDIYKVDNAGDVIVDTAGMDTVMASVSYTLADGAAVEALTTASAAGVAAIDLTGNALANRITGNAGANRLSGGGGNDRLDALNGNDVLDGGAGADLLIGGAGADAFVFSTALGAGNVDMLSDFLHGTDRIELDAGVFAALGTGPLAAGAFAMGTAATKAEHRILYDKATGNLFYDADGSGAGAAVLFATLQNKPANLAANDFVVKPSPLVAAALAQAVEPGGTMMAPELEALPATWQLPPGGDTGLFGIG